MHFKFVAPFSSHNILLAADIAILCNGYISVSRQPKEQAK